MVAEADRECVWSGSPDRLGLCGKDAVNRRMPLQWENATARNQRPLSVHYSVEWFCFATGQDKNSVFANPAYLTLPTCTSTKYSGPPTPITDCSRTPNF